MKDRTRARGVALQALYELDVTDHPVGTVLIERTADSELNGFIFPINRSGSLADPSGIRQIYLRSRA